MLDFCFCLLFRVLFSGQTERTAFGSARRSAAFVDQRGTDGSAAARVEQEDDDQPGLEDIRYTVQFAADVRTRQIR